MNADEEVLARQGVWDMLFEELGLSLDDARKVLNTVSNEIRQDLKELKARRS